MIIEEGKISMDAGKLTSGKFNNFLADLINLFGNKPAKSLILTWKIGL